jgi:hypothetical protein
MPGEAMEIPAILLTMCFDRQGRTVGPDAITDRQAVEW